MERSVRHPGRRSLVLLAMAAFACGGGGTCSGCFGGGGGAGAAASAASDTAGMATPVQIAPVVYQTMRETVSGPGSTKALNAERMRAPFDGVLMSLTVNVGDRVRAGQRIGSFVAHSSYAALQGAQSMAASAATAAEREMAQRALSVARQNVVQTPLTVARGGVVAARSASPGERLSQGDSIISVVTTGRLTFVVGIAQSDIGRVSPGQEARITLVGRRSPLRGTVHSVLPADTGVSMTIPVRVDVSTAAVGAGAPVDVGLFGTATIVVGRHRDTPVVPRGAVVRNDVSGTTRMAVVDSTDHAHWMDVIPGIADSTRVEIVYPRLGAGRPVIVSGQVGLPDGAKVVQASDSTEASPDASGSTGP